MFAISLNSKNYPYEKIGYFRDKVSLPFITPGERSLLGIFINEHPRVLSDGLFAGVMSLRWPLLQFSERKSKVKSLGTKKIDGRKLYVLSYVPDGGGLDEFTIKLYFDAETFAHVRSEYHREFAPNQPNRTTALALWEHLPPLPADKVYQFWLIQGATPVSAGTFRADADGTGTLVIQAPSDMGSYSGLGLTAEPAPGVAAPTGPILASGPL